MSDDAQSPPGPPRPGSQHELLKPFEGRFRATVKLFMGPDQVHESTGVMVNTFQLGGLYLHQDYTGDAVDGPFPSFLGKGYWGFNTVVGRYEGFWIDNVSTVMQTESGEVDDTGKVWTMFGEVTHPATNQAMKKRSVITLLDGDGHRMDTFFTGQDGAEFKSMEIEYTRAQPD